MKFLICLGLLVCAQSLQGVAFAGTSLEIVEATDKLMRGNEAEYRKRMYRLSEAGDIEAQIVFGRFLGQRREFEAAEWWLLNAALKDSSEAQFHLGGLYLQQGSKKADPWLEKAASSGHPGASALLRLTKRKPRVRGNDFHVGDMLSGAGSLLLYKVQSLRDSAVACYGIDRVSLERKALEAVQACGLEIAKGEEWMSSERIDSVDAEFGRCLNREIYQRSGTNRDSIISCLRKVDAP